MCGFVVVASLNSEQTDQGQLEHATAVLGHRGPDDSGYFSGDGVGIGFCRLSIFDLSSAGHQPMISPDGRYVLCFNGAIYNFEELRQDLVAKGHRFRSRGDTEVLLAAWVEWGANCLPRLNGMWAFVIFDRQTRRLFGARDRFGVKPLYWSRTDRSLVFASEIKAIRDAGLAPMSIDRVALADFLLEGRLDVDGRTFYEGPRQVPAGTQFEADLSGRLRWHRYWSIDEAAQSVDVPADPAEAFAHLFEDSIRLRMRSDVPVGVLLSGGLDSTSIVCSMARQLPGPAREHSLGALAYMDPQFDERAYIDATLGQTQAQLLPLDIAPGDVWDSVAAVIWHQDEPVHSVNAVLGYHLMRLARSHGIKVVLNGQGADETLAGYPDFFSVYRLELLRAGRLRTLHRSIRAANGTATDAWARVATASLYRALRWMPGYAALAPRRRRARIARASWVAPALKARWRPHEHADVTTLDAALRHSLEHSHLPVYLRVEDRNSMAHGVEERLPFLDHRLVAFAFRLGADWKLRGSQTKVLLREAMRGRIPEAVRTRSQKFGFPTSVDAWFRGPLFEPLKDLLGSRIVREADIWDVPRLHNALEQHRAGTIDIGESLFEVVQVCHWLDLSHQSANKARLS